MTLNRLNTQETEVDVEGLSAEVKLEFDTSTEEVTGWNSNEISDSDYYF